MTRASDMCRCGGEVGYCDCDARCLACGRLVRDDGTCGCSEGCAPAAARKGRAMEWLLLGAAVLVVLIVVAERLMWVLRA